MEDSSAAAPPGNISSTLICGCLIHSTPPHIPSPIEGKTVRSLYHYKTHVLVNVIVYNE